MRRNYCKACAFAANGVKMRIAIEHTCDGTNIPEPPKHEYIPTREELDLYLARLTVTDDKGVSASDEVKVTVK